MEKCLYRKSVAFEISLAPRRFYVMWRVIEIS